jgi:hypothetical protein
MPAVVLPQVGTLDCHTFILASSNLTLVPALI